MAKGIYRAFLSYKREHEIRLTGSSRTALPNDDEVTDTEVAQIDSTESENKKPQNIPRTDKLVTEAKTQRPIVVESTTNDSEITFKIQILTSSRPLSKNDKRLKGLKDVDYYKENGLYKYTYGASSDYNKVLRTRRNTVTPLFKDAFIIAFRNGEKMNINEAIANFKKRRNK